MPTNMEELDVSELMAVKGGFTGDIVCQAGESAVTCTGKSSGVLLGNDYDQTEHDNNGDDGKDK